GVIVLLGAGGQAYARSHVEDSIATLNRMNLDADDLIYFSELVEAEGMQYTLDAYQAGLGPLSAGERAAQAEEIETALVFDDQRGTPHISRYDIREFVY
ncbi:MAG: radical SAM protein, partial [Anaerolineae bacterium]|nr:radical SAM protein [Anaerolineae bacterium]